MEALFRQLFGAGTRNRTTDLLITNQLLYQLSYAGNIFLDCARHPWLNIVFLRKPAATSCRGVRRAEAMLRLVRLTQLSYAGNIFLDCARY